MKNNRHFIPSLMLLASIFFLQLETAAQEKVSKEEKAAATKQLVETKRYEFVAQSVTPQSGRMRQLTTYYFVRVTPDTVISDLPYFGRSYAAPINPSDAGVNFTSTSFDYEVKNRKKGGWDIFIKPKDKTDYQQLQFTIYDNGSAYLQVISTNRQMISYNGNIGPVKEKNEK